MHQSHKLSKSKLPKQPLMNERRKDPDCKARAQYNPQRKPLLETHKSYEKKQDRRQNTKQRTLCIGGHQSDISGMVVIQP